MKQLTSADHEYTGKRNQTRKELFLIEMGKVLGIDQSWVEALEVDREELCHAMTVGLATFHDQWCSCAAASH